jgi:hypothetical protein
MTNVRFSGDCSDATELLIARVVDLAVRVVTPGQVATEMLVTSYDPDPSGYGWTLVGRPWTDDDWSAESTVEVSLTDETEVVIL